MKYILKGTYMSLEWESKPSQNIVNLLYTAYRLGEAGLHNFRIVIVDENNELEAEYGP